MLYDSKIHIDKIKKTIRNLKKAEIRIRTQYLYDKNSAEKDLVWHDFFDIKNCNSTKGKYTIEQLANMSRQEYKDVVQEFYWNVYYRIYKSSYYNEASTYNIDTLEKLNLPPFADIEQIKTRFRELAKKYHPDMGGSSQEFMEIYKIYKELKEE